MNDFDEDGSSIILSQLHQQEIEEIQSTVNELTKENLKSGMNINISSLKNVKWYKRTVNWYNMTMSDFYLL